MDATTRRLTSPSVWFLAAGIVFAVAGLFPSSVAKPSITFFIRGTIRHIDMFGIATLVCISYSGLYYMCTRVLRLAFNASLSLVHFAVTLLALIGLINLRYINLGYLGLGRGEPPDYNPLIGLLTGHAVELLRGSGILFFGIALLALMIKLRRRVHV
jgi:hypothetical protein